MVPVVQEGNRRCTGVLPDGTPDVYDNKTKGCASANTGVVPGAVATDKAHDHCKSLNLTPGTDDFKECQEEYYEEVKEKREEMRRNG